MIMIAEAKISIVLALIKRNKMILGYRLEIKIIKNLRKMI
jgi:hypothetical protein